MAAPETMYGNLVIGILGGSLTLSALSLAFFGIMYPVFVQLEAQKEGMEDPEKVTYKIKWIAYWTLSLTILSSLTALSCVAWIFAPKDHVLFFIIGCLAMSLILVCGLIGYIIRKMMYLPDEPEYKNG